MLIVIKGIIPKKVGPDLVIELLGHWVIELLIGY